MTEMMRLGSLLRLARDTIAHPREGAETVLSFAPPRQALALMFALVVVLSILIGEVVLLVSPPTDEGPLTGASPMAMGAVQAMFLYLMIHAIHIVGRFFGGTGAFEEAALLVIWLQAIFLLVQVIQLFAVALVPPLLGTITIVALVLFVWLLVNFIAVLHGFTSLGMVFVMTVMGGFTILFFLSLTLTLLGLVPDPEAAP